MRSVILTLIILLFVGNASADINFMVYMMGSDLEADSGAATSDVYEMLRSETAETTHVYVMTGGSQTWALAEAIDAGTTILEITDGQLRVIQSEVGGACGISKALEQFIRVCSAETPSDERILVLWGHGCEGDLGIGYDAIHDDDMLTLTEIRQGVLDSCIHIDILGFDACDMATEAVSMALGGCCDRLLASSRTMPLAGWPYRQILNNLTGEADNDCTLILNTVNIDAARHGEDSILERLF